MPLDYSFLENVAPKPEVQETKPINTGIADVTFRSDADCYLQCDGENIEPRLVANRTVKIQLPLGIHFLEFISVENPEIRMDRQVEYKECKNYIELVQGLLAKLVATAQNSAPQMPAQNAFLDQLNAMTQMTMGMQMPGMPQMPNMPNVTNNK